MAEAATTYTRPTVLLKRHDNMVRCTLHGPSADREQFHAFRHYTQEHGAGLKWNGIIGPDGYSAIEYSRLDSETLATMYAGLQGAGFDVLPSDAATLADTVRERRYTLRVVSEGHETYTVSCSPHWHILDLYFDGQFGPLLGVHTRTPDSSVQRYTLTGVPYMRATVDELLSQSETQRRSTHGRDVFVWHIGEFLRDEAKAQSSDESTRQPLPELAPLLAQGATLMPHQNQMVRKLIEVHGKLIIGDQMGLGKTLEALAYVALQKQRAIVVCPKNVQGNWLREAKRFLPSYFKGYTLEGTPSNLSDAMTYEDRKEFRLVTINYTNIDRLDVFTDWFLDLQTDPDTHSVIAYDRDVALVVDESHRIKEGRSKATKALLFFGQYAETRLAMSGTPIKNSAGEVWTQLEFVRPGYISSRSSLVATYTPASIRQRMIRDGLYMGRTLESAGVQLPAKTSVVVDIKMPDVDDPVIESIGDIARERARFCREKAPYTAGRMLDLLDEDDTRTILLFTDFVSVARDVAEMINDDKPDCAVVHTGSTPDDERQRIRNMFDPSVPDRLALRETTRVVCATTQSLKEGSNMQEMSMVVFSDLPWTSTDLQQAEARVWRTGQNKEIEVYWIAAEGSAWDDHMASTIERKMILTEALNKGKILTPEETKFARESISEEEILAKFGKRKN